MKFTSHSEKETANCAAKLAKKLKGGETLALSGELGAGKTAFTRGLAQALGVKQMINSPTFVFMKVYELPKAKASDKKKTIKRLVHVDAYRAADARTLRAIGLEDYIGDAETVVVIEWAERVKEILPAKIIHISFEHRLETQRFITVV